MFGFPSANRETSRQFKSNLLKTVIFQIKFPINHEIIEKKEEIKERLSQKYPNVTDINSNQGKIQLSPEKTPILVSTSKSHDGFEFRSSSKHSVLAITKDMLTLSVLGTSYSNSSKVFQDFEEIYIPLIEMLNINILNRVAIRKINMLEAVTKNKSDCQDVLKTIYNNNLIANTVFMPSESTLGSSLSSTSLLDMNEEYRLVLNYGLLEEKPEQKEKKLFTYDIDVFTMNRETESTDLLTEFQKINKEMYNIFIWGMNPELIKKLCNKDLNE